MSRDTRAKTQAAMKSPPPGLACFVEALLELVAAAPALVCS
jgi:hypothetical protein